MAKPAIDPWLQNADGSPDPFTHINWNMPDLPDLEDTTPAEGDPVLEPVPPDPNAPPVEPVVPPEPPPDDSPETTVLDDGTELSIEKEKGQWKGVVSNPTGGSPQVYWGKTLKELIFNTLKAQANATKKIREQNARLKFGAAPAKPVVQQPAPSSVRALTADEIFEIKTQLESDPGLALDNLFQKRTGLTVEQLVNLVKQGSSKAEYASNQLTAESVNKTFLANNPDYYPDANYANFGMLIKWLAKFKLGETYKPGEETTVFDKLVSTGNYTVENMEEAFQDLKNDGLLILAPKPPKALPQADTPPPVAVQPNEPAPAPRPDSRIVSQVTRPRAAYGIGRSDVTPVAPANTPEAPSVEDFEKMTDKEIAEQIALVQRHLQKNRR